MLFGFFDSVVLPVDLGNAVDEELGEVLRRDPRPLKTNLGSMLSRLLA